jgi:hypothetical protein
MKTLVIHPKDDSTTFLETIYKDIEATVVTDSKPREELVKLILSHDRVMMMGHGSTKGLFSTDEPYKHDSKASVKERLNPYLIDKDIVPHLLEKECYFIWCNADEFVKYHKLKGFYTGMFVSEVMEAFYCGINVKVRKDMFMDIDRSNNEFSTIVSESLRMDKEHRFAYVKEEYSKIAQDNDIAQYNLDRLYNKE